MFSVNMSKAYWFIAAYFYVYRHNDNTTYIIYFRGMEKFI